MASKEQSRLIILGNGFDLYHGLKTKYSDFKDYLQENIGNTNNYTINKADFVKDDKYFCGNTKDIIDIIYTIINNSANAEWSDFEEALGEINYEEVLSYYQKIGDNESETALIINRTMRFIQTHFSDWIKQVNYLDFKPKFKFKEDDIFLTFNYSRTLEDYYHINSNRICHIHGVINRNDDGETEEYLIFGHGKEMVDSKYSNNKYIKSTFEYLKKNKNLNRDKFENFLKTIKNRNIREIYDFGFSYSDVDKSYINEIVNIINNNAITWFSNVHCNNKCIFYDIQNRKKIINDFGFMGKTVITCKCSNKTDILK